jgi:hypothetical protein
VINVGLSQGRIKSITTSGLNATHITLDETVTMEAGPTYGVVIRTAESTELIKTVMNVPGETNVLEFTTPFNLLTSKMETDNLVMFGISGQETIDIIIKEIIPEQNFNVRIVARDYNEAIFTASAGPIPPFVSGTTFPPELNQPVIPVLVAIQSDEEVQVTNMDGSISSRMVFTLINNNVGPVTPEVIYRQVGTSTYIPANTVVSTPELVIIDGLDQDLFYDIQIRYKRAGAVSGIINNILSPPLDLLNIEFVGTSTVPPNVTNFRLRVIGQTSILSWDAVQVIDLDFYEIKFSPLTSGATYASASLLADEVTATTYVTPTQSGTYFIKAVDRGNNKSVTEAIIINEITTTGFNAVENLIEQPTFQGTHDNTTVVADKLQLIDDSLPGYYYFANAIDLTDVFTSRVVPTLVAALSGPSGFPWLAEIQMRTTQDDPTGAPSWSAWFPVTFGDYLFWGAEFRVCLQSGEIGVTPQVSVAEITIDMPDRVERFEDQVVPVGGFLFVIDPEFKQMLDVQVTGQNLQQGDYWTVTFKSQTGGKVTFYNSAGSSVQRTADVQFSGYGSVQP